MKYEILFIIGIAIFVGAIVFRVILKDLRRAFLVPEGYAGLLYHKGKFVEVLGTGRHVRWGLHFTLDTTSLQSRRLRGRLAARREALHSRTWISG